VAGTPAVDAGDVSPTAALLARLARPYDPVRAVAALLGLSPRSARQLVGTVLATCPEADDLLDAMPRIVRSLSIATTDRPTRCYGELRGPVLWSETMSARSASAGDPGLYVCATTTKAYDTEENRALKAALETIRRAGNDADDHVAEHEPLARHARANSTRALRFIDHQTLFAVPATHVTGRSLRRTRAGSRRTTYQPAIAMLRRAGDPLRAEHLEAAADEATLADHALLERVLQAVSAEHGPLPPLRTAQGRLAAGPVRYHHPAGRVEGDGPEGVTVRGRRVERVEEVAGALGAP
jgi:hypothetical protein